MLAFLLFKKTSKKSILIFIIEILSIVIKSNKNIICRINLNLADLRKFMSAKNPIKKKININKKKCFVIVKFINTKKK